MCSVVVHCDIQYSSLIFRNSTSESHSLIAGLSGAAIAIQQGVGGINFDEWVKVLYGLVLSLILGFATGWVVCKLITVFCRSMDRRKTNRFFWRCADCRCGSHEFYAWSTGRSEIHRCFCFWESHLQEDTIP